MELKRFQEEVLNDLESYLDYLLLTRNPSTAYNKLWESKHVRVGFGGMNGYKDLYSGVPAVCLKVPTGGGKTVLGCSALKPIFDRMSSSKKKVVVWLVPWETILTQTYSTFSNPEHFYRQRLNRDFASKVRIYNKSQLLDGENFNPTTIDNQLSICILSFDSLRSSKKDGKKVFEQNSALMQFVPTYKQRDRLIEGVDETALIQVLNQLNPVVVIDESHNAKSDLSLDMIKSLNPSLVVELTATPKKNSNIISIVSADKLKGEHMVKLPVIAYNRPSVERVIAEAIDLQSILEKKARTLHNSDPEHNPYIRPIVLFQAQPKNDNDSVTFDRIKQNLMTCGIPESQIAIKMAKKNEIKDINLLSEDCEIRYIITVNALKEGWDCPFAYILASLANRTSKVDVEQILGRILRQPSQKQYSDSNLNMCYVLASSVDFNKTLESIVEGLNSSGFTKNDCRVAEVAVEETKPTNDEPLSIFDFAEDDTEDVDGTNFNIEDISQEVRETIQSRENEGGGNTSSNSLEEMLNEASKQEEEYNQAFQLRQEEGSSDIAPELRDNMNIFRLNEQYKEEIASQKLPQFCIRRAGLFSGEDSIDLLSKDDLVEGFSLDSCAIPSNILVSRDDIRKIDVVSTAEGSRAQITIDNNTRDAFREMLRAYPEEAQIVRCKERLLSDINNRMDIVSYSEIKRFVDRFVDSLTTAEDINILKDNITAAGIRLKDYINKMLDDYRETKFKQMCEREEIFLRDTYSFPNSINPLTSLSLYPKSLYSEEEDSLTDVEVAFVSKVSSLDNVLCWHRIIDRKGYCLNGFINHYADFVVFTKSGKVILVETKGEHLANDDSKKKLTLGKIWERKAGQNKYRYYMAFKQNPMPQEGSYLVDEVVDIIKQL